MRSWYICVALASSFRLKRLHHGFSAEMANEHAEENLRSPVQSDVPESRRQHMETMLNEYFKVDLERSTPYMKLVHDTLRPQQPRADWLNATLEEGESDLFYGIIKGLFRIDQLAAECTFALGRLEAAQKKRRVLVLGSSVAWGWEKPNTQLEQSWVRLLERQLNAQADVWHVENLARPMTYTEFWLKAIDNQAAVKELIKTLVDGDVIFVSLSLGNEFLDNKFWDRRNQFGSLEGNSGWQLASQFTHNLWLIVHALKILSPHAKIVLGSPYPCNVFTKYHSPILNDVSHKIAQWQKQGKIDYFVNFMQEPVVERGIEHHWNPDFMTLPSALFADGVDLVHPNEEGHRMMYNCIVSDAGHLFGIS